jgi:hypothetical protein
MVMVGQIVEIVFQAARANKSHELHFVKSINFNKKTPKNGVSNHSIDFSEYYRAFGFADSMQKDKMDLLRKFYQENEGSRLLPDIASSVMKHIFSDGFIKKDKFKDILECIQDIISDLQYIELTETALANLMNVSTETTRNVMLIAGCQNRKMLDNRVDRAVEIAALFYNNIHPVACGANPDSKKPTKIFNESTRIINRFTTGIKKQIEDKSKRPKIDVLPEDKSKNTKDNIAKFFEGHFLDNTLDNQLIVVSSTSHLIRLSKNIETYLEENKAHLNYKISNIILVGAEGIDTIFYIDNDHLFKHMLLEIYDYLLIKRYNIG